MKIGMKVCHMIILNITFMCESSGNALNITYSLKYWKSRKYLSLILQLLNVWSTFLVMYNNKKARGLKYDYWC